MRKRIVITGLGCVCPVGNTPQSSWQALLSARSGVSEITLFDASRFTTRIGAEVKSFTSDFPALIAKYPHAGRNSLFALAAASQAVADSGLQHAGYDRSRLAVYTGAGEGTQNFEQTMEMIAQSSTGPDFQLKEYNRLALAGLHAQQEMEQEPHLVPARLAGEFGFEGVNLNTLTACAAASQAIGESAHLIRSGAADAVLTGGTSSMIHPFGITGFCLLTTLSKRNESPHRASRPFDKDRDGFVLGEGAGMLVLEEYEAARRRSATIYAELSGYGTTADAYRITDIHPEGRGAADAMRMALRNANLNTDDIDYLNAHGTSTKANDHLETLSIRKVFGADADRLAVSSTKSMTGHLVAAGGGIEAVFSVLALRNGVVPPTANYETPDPACDLDYVPNQPREIDVAHVMSNSFGFGGQNVSLVFSRI